MNSKRKIAKNIFAVVLILAGICVIAYPWVKAWYFNMLQAKAMQTWLDSAGHGETAIDTGNKNSDLEGVDIWEEDVNSSFDLEYVTGNMEGILIIDKINLRTPILKNATKHNLDISVSSVANTGEMGHSGNYVLAGHKSRVYGRHFNRLLEVAKGDSVVVHNGTDVYQYVVYETFSVQPSETWVLDSPEDADKKLITLITCDYRMNPIGRFIVRGELDSDAPTISTENKQDN